MLARLFRENFRRHASFYLVSILAMLVVALMTSLSAWIMRDIVDSVYLKRDFSVVLTIATTVAGIFAVKGVATFVQSYYLSKAGNSIVAEQQNKIYERLLRQGVSYFSQMPSSELLVRVTHNAQAARAVIDTIVTSFVRDLFSLLGLITVMFVQNVTLTCVAMIVGPAAILSVRLILKKARRVMQAELASISQIIGLVQETSVGLRVIKAFSLESMMQGRMANAVSDVEVRANSIAKLESATGPIMETLSGFAIAAVIALSGYAVIEGGKTPGDLMSFTTALLLAYEPAKRLARTRIMMEAGVVGVRMMFEILDAPITLNEAENPVSLALGRGEVVFEDVDFAYAGDVPVLRNVNVRFEGGKTTAVVGPSGSGKSTIVNLLMRLYDPQHGSVRIDGIDIRQASFESLRAGMSYVGQDIFLFAGSIRSNIAVGRTGATEAEIIEAAKVANAHEFIQRLPQGYETDVGENGGNLSGGQKQRLAIARAILRNAQILILDEATSALDSESEVQIRESLTGIMRGRTTIIIAHRLSTIARADRVVVLDAGRVVEQGSQSVLLSREGSYRRLYELQLLPGVVSEEVFEDSAVASRVS
ncbi:ABC transporter ATP-binding protein [Ciceribacter sp. RN22]|uniref:ABC transporter ATP-binding protein n=1 Tax=Ciceribacter sp. RN22 TaxID=2954932 RepID=UPI00209335D0|nr:ABC transporter ATP-binding protein [Ciceribacter sp. RN22]MCO6181104.1 ABC transporter ATP-binding protein/permease [Ciceribacter sp. RN22]